MQKAFIDYVGKLPHSKAGNTSILVCVDAFYNFVWMISVRQATTRATTKSLKERIFSRYSVPEILVSDNALCFVFRKFLQFCFELDIKHVITSLTVRSPHMPNDLTGTFERQNQTKLHRTPTPTFS